MTVSIKQFEVASASEVDSSKVVGRIALFDADGNPVELGGGEAAPTAWADITGKPAVIAAGADAAAARTAIGAGTSSLALGTTASTAAAGNHTQSATTVTVAASAGIVGANVQAVLADLAARIVALES